MKRPSRRAPRGALVAALLLVPGLAAGAPRPVAPPSCGAAPADAPVAVSAVSDDLDLTLADGRVLRLAGIDAARATSASPDLPARARRALDAWLAAGPALLHPLSPSADRWGRVPALLLRADGELPGAAGALLRAGLARAKPEADVHGCFPAFLGDEAAARTEGLGLWGDPRYAVLAAGDADGLAAQAGGMALVQGILHVHEGRGAFYLALGRDRWGFAAVVPRPSAQRFVRDGFDLHDYEGTPVRLRGDLDSRFGPRLRFTEADGLESLEPGSIAEEAQAPGRNGPKHWTVPPRPR